MKLEGSLDAFGLADVCTLLSSTGKSGALELTKRRTGGPAMRGVVWFSSGQISGASADLTRQNLARRIIGAGAVDDLALRHAVARVVSGGIGVARALLEAGAVDALSVQQAATEQVTDAMSELLTWTEGEFAFNADQVDPDEVGIAVSVAAALEIAHVRQQQWSNLHSAISGPEAILSLTPGVASDPSVTRDEWGVMALVDGHRNVQELAELTGAGLYAVTSILAGLVQRGLLTVKDPTSPDYVSNLERRFAMLMSLEEAPIGPRSAVGSPSATGSPGGRGATTAGALNGATASPSATGDVARGQFVPAVGALVGAGGVDAYRDAAETGSVSESSRAFAVSRPGGLGSQVMAAQAGSLRAGAYEGGDSRSQTATAPAVYAAELLQRDPSLNRTLLLRLIAGVRGL